MYKIKTYKTIVIFISLIFALACKDDTIQKEFDFAQLLPERFEKSNIISEENYNIWGTNIAKGKDGKYHAIYSRWPKSRGHLGWVTHCEIAHAISDNLTGPYIFKNLVLPPRGGNYWDGHCTHNPHLMEHNGKYYLYHMGNFGSGHWESTLDTVMPKYKDTEWWINRNNQRVGVAVADNLNGEWKRFDKPLIDISLGRLMTSTPTASVRPDGKILLAYKYVVDDGTERGGQVIHVTSLSENPLGPFVDTKIPFITHPTVKFAIDDHVEWSSFEKYWGIAKDCEGVFTNYPKETTLLFESDAEGLNWKPAKNSLVILPGEIKWTDGSVTKTQRTADMPKVYLENGIPKALIIAVLPNDSEISFSLVIPLKNS